MSQSEFVGVDACSRGWFSVGLSSGDDYELKVFSSFEKLLEHYSDAKLILVDMPIGLPEDSRGRKCDGIDWRKLGWPRGMSVFPTPTRQTAHQAAKFPKDHAAAEAVENEISGKGLSHQTFGIAPKIAEVDMALLNPARAPKPLVREVHPEFCFWALNRGRPMQRSKKDDDGIKERLAVLGKAEQRTHDIFCDARARYFKTHVADDDILDALVAAVTGKGGWPDNIETLPKNPKRDLRCLPMEIVYWRP